MPKIKGWSKFDDTDDDFPHVWKHDDRPIKVVVKRKDGLNDSSYDVYAIRRDSPGTNYKGKNIRTLDIAKEEARDWMRDNPDGIEVS